MIEYLLNLLTFTSVFAARSCDPKTHKVFLHGTLKRGEPNHNILKEPKNGLARFLAPAKTEKRYPMVIATKYHMPFILASPGRGCLIVGELYEVDDLMLRQFDVLKDHPHLYERELENVVIRNQKTGLFETHECWVYFLKAVTPELLARPCISTYSSKGPHGLLYVRHKHTTLEDLKDEVKA